MTSAQPAHPTATHPRALLLVLDGVGLAPPGPGNALSQAQMPTWQKLWATCPHSQLLTHGPAVGLPPGQMGGSEVGHLNLGAGRVVNQLLDKIASTFAATDFPTTARGKIFFNALQPANAVHLIGLVSDGGIHSHLNYLLTLLPHLAALHKPIYLHIITDGRDTPPYDAPSQLLPLLEALRAYPQMAIADVCGRYYAMDRDNRWDRTAAAYTLYTQAQAQHHAADLRVAVHAAHQRGEGDEFLQPTRLLPGTTGQINTGDAVVFLNFRPDRMRQIARALAHPGFTDFPRPHHPALAACLSMTDYAPDLAGHITPLFQKELVPHTLGEIISQQGWQQLRLAETEKFPHVTSFFSGGREDPFPGEDRTLVPSPKVTTYDHQPEMSLPAVTQHLTAALANPAYRLIVANFANGDMVGHTGRIPAAIQALEAIDRALATLLPVAAAHGVDVLICADHGNCEEMLTPTGQPITSHSTNPVPLVYVGPRALHLHDGVLADLAPTILHLLGLPIPPVMTGKVLVKEEKPPHA